MEPVQKATKTASLYERLGGEAKVRKIVNDILDKNYNNPDIGHYFRNVDMKKLKQLVFEFFSMGTGGSHKYTGRDMRTSHASLKINEEDFVAIRFVILIFVWMFLVLAQGSINPRCFEHKIY